MGVAGKNVGTSGAVRWDVAGEGVSFRMCVCVSSDAFETFAALQVTGLKARFERTMHELSKVAVNVPLQHASAWTGGALLSNLSTMADMWVSKAVYVASSCVCTPPLLP